MSAHEESMSEAHALYENVRIDEVVAHGNFCADSFFRTPAAVNTLARTHYDVLGVAAGAHPVVIKAAYRALAKEYHPDVAGGGGADLGKFIALQTAYSVLSDPERRLAYDAELREPVPADPVPEQAAQDQAAQDQAAQDQAALARRLAARLALFSGSLAASFQHAVEAGQYGEDLEAFAGQLERDFFTEYFGDDPDVQSLARLLLLKSRTAAALELNALVAGALAADGADVRAIIASVVERHCADEPLFADWLKVKFGLKPLHAMPAAAAAARPGARPHSPPSRRVAVARRPERSERSFTLRSFATLAFWASALYFALFAAFPLVQ